MQPINEIIHLIDTQRQDGVIDRWVYTTAEQANIIAGTAPTAKIWAYFTAVGKLTLATDGLTCKDSAKITVYFLTPQGRLDANQLNVLELQTVCLTVAKDLLTRVGQSKVIRLAGNVVASNLMHSVNDRALAGVKLEFTAEVRAPECLSLADPDEVANVLEIQTIDADED